LQASLIDLKAYLHPTFDIFKIMLINFDADEMDQLKTTLTALDIPNVSIQQSGIGYIIKNYQINPEEAAALGNTHCYQDTDKTIVYWKNTAHLIVS